MNWILVDYQFTIGYNVINRNEPIIPSSMKHE